MADFLLELASNKNARKVVQTLGLPLPMPERLERGQGPWEERPLHGRTVVVGGRGDLGEVLATTLASTGADGLMIGRAAQGRPWIFREILHYLAHGTALPPPTVVEAHAAIVLRGRLRA